MALVSANIWESHTLIASAIPVAKTDWPEDGVLSYEQANHF